MMIGGECKVGEGATDDEYWSGELEATKVTMHTLFTRGIAVMEENDCRDDGRLT